MKKTWSKQAICKSNDKSCFPHSFCINSQNITERLQKNLPLLYKNRNANFSKCT